MDGAVILILDLRFRISDLVGVRLAVPYEGRMPTPHSRRDARAPSKCRSRIAVSLTRGRDADPGYGKPYPYRLMY